MAHPYFTRSIATAAAIGLLAIASPAFAQSTPPDQQTQQPTSPATTQTQTPPSASTCPTGTSPGSTTNCPTSTTTTTGGGTVTRGPAVPLNSNSTTGTPSTNTPTTNTPTTNTMPSNTTPTTTTPSSATGSQPTAGTGMTNALRDNPNGANWLAKYNRPRVAASNMRRSRYRTHKLGTTTPPKP